MRFATASPKKWREIFISNMEQRAPGIFWLCYWRVLCRHIFSISPISTSGLVSLFGAVFMMINMRFKEIGSPVHSGRCGRVKKRILSQFSRIETSGFSSYLLWGRGLSITFLINNFSCLYAGLFESHDVGTRPVWLSQLIPVVLEALCMAIIPFFVNQVGPKNALLIG